ncbi:hypothetical protein HU200_034425 [Digitaria exilis]|uniref:Dirigent protein n=1 Tax=Digitaria exilis TaxID=1010633 RepID=A0A835BGI6_9POAL|nr:hypothetical protein HU200_034425 [Digitaria exilis]
MAEDNKGAYFEILPVELQKQELRMTLFVHQVVRGPEQNQQVVVPRSNPPFGLVVANDWTVFDGLGSGASLVGNAQGMHMLGSMTQDSWCIYFDLLLGSFGQVDGEWAIVGGTGEFTLAQGVISFKKVQDSKDMNIRELKLRVFYTPIKV